MNCLAYALRFWEKEPSYKLYYRPGHVINSDIHIMGPHWLPAEEYGYCYFVSSFDGLLDEYEQALLKRYFKIDCKQELSWLSQQDMKIEKKREENFWNNFVYPPWEQPLNKRKRLGLGLYEQLTKRKLTMNTLSLRYFVVLLRTEDAFNECGVKVLHPIFNGAVRYCREKLYGTSFSMCPQVGFQINSKESFRVYDVKVNGKTIGRNPGENEIRQYIKDNNVVEVIFIEDPKDILK